MRKAGSPHRSYVEQCDHVGFGRNKPGWPLPGRHYTGEQRGMRDRLFTRDPPWVDQGLDIDRFAMNARRPQYFAYPFDKEYSPSIGPKPLPVKLPSFSGKQQWATWVAQFETIAYLYRWDDEENLNQLLPRLEGEAAQFVFTQLSPYIINDYQDLVGELNSRFRVIETPGRLRQNSVGDSRDMEKALKNMPLT
ncbi:hypothetical protein DPMN_094351 [Dreissena polymorpha]|uniref:Uncharacterized protein n=1 Tax=Dreissena polymorpha TaxID=45954 RepID=A0A9D4R1V8_DREPO|nr:hypothetical protein DPMN_094351 [Dreissena polymorpha]